MGSESSPSPLNVHKLQRGAKTATTELCRFKGKIVRPKLNRSNTFLYLMVRRPNFQHGGRMFSAWPIFMACCGLSPMVSMFHLLTKRCPSQPYIGTFFPVRIYKSISLPGTFSHGLSWIMATVILCVTLPHSAFTLGAKVQCLQSLTSRRVQPGVNTFPSLLQWLKINATCVQMVRILNTRSFVYISCERFQINATC